MEEPKKPSKKLSGDEGRPSRKLSGDEGRPSKKLGDERPSKKLSAGDERPSKKLSAGEPEKTNKASAGDSKARLHECPRCHLSLQPEKYEGVAVDYCDQCWGYWVARLEFETILTSKDEHFSRDEKKNAGRAPAHVGDRQILSCVKCGKTMSKLAVEDDGMVAFLVDYCRDHGLWLDTGEIKRAQILDERTGAVRKALRSSFDRAAVEADDDS